MPPLNTTLTADEQRFFETGELQPGMEPDPPALEAPAPPPIAPTPVNPPVSDPPAPDLAAAQQHQTEVAEILRRSLAEAQQRAAQLEHNIAQLQQQQKPPPVPEPDPALDPLGAMMHKLETVNKLVADLQTTFGQQQTQQQQVETFRQFQAQVHSLREQFTKTTPDFPDAYTHLRNLKSADLRVYGYTEDQIKQALFQEEAAIADKAIQNGKNPAEVIYEMAKRHGYATRATGPATPTSPDTKLTNIAAAQAAAKTLPSTPVLEDITVDGLKGASDADLNKLVSDDKMWSKIVGSDKHPI